MSPPPRRYKDLDELTSAEHERRQLAARRGETTPRFETPEYEQARAAALERAGLHDDDERSAA